VFTNVKPDMVIAKEEIFGPVLCVMKADTFDEAVEIVKPPRAGQCQQHLHEQRQGRARVPLARRAEHAGRQHRRRRPMAFFRSAGQGELLRRPQAHGQDSVEFYTDKKVTIARWF